MGGLWASMTAHARRRLGLRRLLPALGVGAAAVLAVSVNVLVSRFYARWDWTSRRLYTLSDATLAALHELAEPVNMTVLLSRSDPLEPSVRQLITAYAAETHELVVRYVDPDRSPAEFLAVQQKYGIVAGKTEDGRVVADTSLVVARGNRHWFVTSDQLVLVDEPGEQGRPNVEQALTEAIVNVQGSDRATVCFSSGHQEVSLDNGGPHGLGELKYRLERGNFVVSTLELESPRSRLVPEQCRLLVVAGPAAAFSPEAAERIVRYLDEGGSLLVLAGPMFDQDERLRPNGLETVVARAGVEFGRDMVLERDPAVTAPMGQGETFQAKPKSHEITLGMIRDSNLRVLVTAAQSLGKTRDSSAVALLETSDQAASVSDLRPLAEGNRPAPSAHRPPFVLAMASELPKSGRTNATHGPRVIVVGTPSIVWNDSFREPALRGNRLLGENLLAWLLARRALVSVPPKAAEPLGVGLSQASLGEVFRYVLFYMPATAAGLGLLVMRRRRTRERRSRARRGSER
jgi:hypothetical protein